MALITFIMTVCLSLALAWGPAAAAPRVGADGASLVLEGDSRKSAASGDTLFDLQAREVHAYITRTRTWVWSRGTGAGPAVPAWRPLSNPHLEALIGKYSLKYGVDAALVRAVMRHESGFNPGAVSPKGAQGLMQLMPGTAALMGVRNPFDPEQNIDGGVGYLRRCLDRFQHNVPLAVAAYNAGPEAVAKYCSVPPYSETQVFVKNVMGSYGGPAPAGNLKGAAKSGAPASGPAPKRKSTAKKPPKEQVAQETSRPRAKIIEVRPSRPKPRPSRDKDD